MRNDQVGTCVGYTQTDFAKRVLVTHAMSHLETYLKFHPPRENSTDAEEQRFHLEAAKWCLSMVRDQKGEKNAL